jgi:putative ATPase
MAEETGSVSPPKHILNATTRLMKDIEYGIGYEYDHDSHNEFSGQNYFPGGVTNKSLYEPDGRGFEKEIVKRLNYWEKLRNKKNKN